MNRRFQELDYDATKAAMKKVGVDWPNVFKPSRTERALALAAIGICLALAVLGLYADR